MIKGLENKKNIAILGFGKEGFSTLKFLLKNNIKNITILDKNIPEDSEKLDLIEKNCIKTFFGEKYLDNLSNYDVIIKSPGITPYHEKILPYKENLTSQTQIFFDNYNGKVIGITGSKGKSTTSTLAYKLLSTIFEKVKLVGNIGTPVLDEIDINSKEEYDYIVYELSSYMLEGLNPTLEIGLLNNIYDVHLDWHHGRDNYQKAKLNVLANSKYKLVNSELENHSNIKKLSNLEFFGEKGKYKIKNKDFFIDDFAVFKDENIALNGFHNRKNICGVLGILDVVSNEKNLSENIDKFKEILASFGGLPNRIEYIGTYNGIKFINDAMATTPESTMAAINTFGDKIGTLFLGGQDSGFTFDELRKTITSHNIKNIVLFPDTGEKIFGDLSDFDYESNFLLDLGNYKPKIFKTKSMKSAINFAFENTDAGKIVLLSSAAPSFSLWKNYQHKADEFIEFTKEYKNS